jgi:hypothetical protein
MAESATGRSSQDRPSPSRPLSGAEDSIWAAFFVGEELNLSAVGGDEDAADGASWEPPRTARGEVLADLLTRFVDRRVHPRAGLRIVGVRITGTWILDTPTSWRRCHSPDAGSPNRRC